MSRATFQVERITQLSGTGVLLISSRDLVQTSAMSDKMIPLLQGAEPVPVRTRRPIQSPRVIVFASLVFWVLVLESIVVYWSISARRTVHIPLNAAQILGKCNALTAKPGPPADFAARTRSDRFQQGTKPVLIRNATLWTGRVQGLEVVRGDLFLDQGLIKAVGHVGPEVLNTYRDVVTVDAHGYVHRTIAHQNDKLTSSDGGSRPGALMLYVLSSDRLDETNVFVASLTYTRIWVSNRVRNCKVPAMATLSKALYCPGSGRSTAQIHMTRVCRVCCEIRLEALTVVHSRICARRSRRGHYCFDTPRVCECDWCVCVPFLELPSDRLLYVLGGQAFVIKLRPTEERSPSSMLLEPPFGYNGSEIDPSLPPRWRHMKYVSIR